MAYPEKSVDQPIEERAPLGRRRGRHDRPAVGPKLRWRGRLRSRFSLDHRGGAGRRIEPALAPAAGKAKRGHQGADHGDTGNPQVGPSVQFGHSCIDATIADHALAATAWPPEQWWNPDLSGVPWPRH